MRLQTKKPSGNLGQISGKPRSREMKGKKEKQKASDNKGVAHKERVNGEEESRIAFTHETQNT